MVIDLVIAVLLIFIFYHTIKIQQRIILKHSTFFIISFFIVYYQYPIEYILGNTLAISSIDMAYKSEFCKCLCLSNIILAAFIVGNSMYKVRNARISKKDVTDTFKNNRLLSARYVTFISVTCLFLFFVTVDKNYLLGGHGRYLEGDAASMFGNLLQTSLIALFSIKAYNYKRVVYRQNIVSFWRTFRNPMLILGIYLILMSMSGSRYVTIRMIMLVICVYIYAVRPKIRPIVLAAGVISFAFLFAIQGIMRANKNITFNSAKTVINEMSSISPLTSELAFSVTTLHIATSNIPKNRDYNYGMTVLPEFLYIIPGGRTVFFSMLDIPEELQGSTKILTKLGLGSLDEYGLGSSSIADIYISFGIIGAIIFFFFFGKLIRYIEEFTYRYDTCSIYMLSVSFCFFSQMFYSNRESLFNVLVGLPYVLLFVYISIKTSKH